MNPEREERGPVALTPRQRALVQNALDSMDKGAEPMTFAEAIAKARDRVCMAPAPNRVAANMRTEQQEASLREGLAEYQAGAQGKTTDQIRAERNAKQERP